MAMRWPLLVMPAGGRSYQILRALRLGTRRMSATVLMEEVALLTSFIWCCMSYSTIAPVQLILAEDDLVILRP